MVFGETSKNELTDLTVTKTYTDNVSVSRKRGARPETIEKYREALALYATASLSSREICSKCAVSLTGFQCYIWQYHRHLILARYGINCTPEEAQGIRLGQRRKQRPSTHAKYKEAIEACDSMEYIGFNVSQIAREFGLNGTNLGRQLRTHYPEVIERREKARERLGISDNLPRGTRQFCTEQYAEAVELLRADRYITVQEAAEQCNVSYSGLEQHLVFYHKELVEKRILIRKQAVRQQYKGKITGRGTPHAPKPETVALYAEALHLYRTTLMSARKIAAETKVSRKGFYEYLQKWHMDLVCQRKGIPYEEGCPVDWSEGGRYNPATKAKYAEAIERLKESGLPIAKVATALGLHPECFRQYLKEHEPELHASLGMKKMENGKRVSLKSMEKYSEAVHWYSTTSESLRSIAGRLGIPYNSIGGFVRRNYPEAIKAHNRLLEQERDALANALNPQQEKEPSGIAGFARQRAAKEKERILQALKQAGGHKRDAAKLLGISKSTLYDKLHALGLAEVLP